MRKIPCGKGKQFFLQSQSLSLDRFRLQAIGLRTVQGNLTYSRGRKKNPQPNPVARKNGKSFSGRKTFNEIKNAVKLKKTHTPY
jgi:hypothetical protein